MDKLYSILSSIRSEANNQEGEGYEVIKNLCDSALVPNKTGQPKPCKRCGAEPTLIKGSLDGINYDVGYMCSNHLRNQCPPNENTKEDEALRIWNENN